jgi:hypothetical protein
METNFAYEKLGLLYLGRELNIDGDVGTSMPLLLKSKILTTHAAIIGMTGSGKTGLGIGLLEEAIMDNIPSIIIDPKGDMGNLLLTFPEMQPENFVPWIDPAEAEKKGMSVEGLAAETAKTWKEGLRFWDQDIQRIAALREKTEFTIYTPGSSAGVPVSVLQSFAAPSADVLQESDTLNGLVDSLVGGLLSLVKIKADSSSREYILLSSLFLHNWRKGDGLDMEGLIGNVVNPPFKKIGVFSLDVFYPQSERMKLAMALNGILASPAFAAWTQGEPLDIQKILYGDEGRPNTAIFSIAHLNETERMFFVTMLLNRIIDWMRRQQGTSSLKALLYMDEIFGYFPPTANPPSKKPMLLLLKQARAYGVGVVLATQNPVDLDYKGLSNIGTWFIGRLQTVQDQNRVIDGIASESADGVEKSTFRRLLSGMAARRFLLKSAHLDDIRLFESRWVMSYLKGPIALFDIEKLMEKKKNDVTGAFSGSDISSGFKGGPDGLGAAAILEHPPLIADTIRQCYYLHPVVVEKYLFEPWLAAKGHIRIFNAKRNIDRITDVSVRLSIDERFTQSDWQRSEENPYSSDQLSAQAPAGSSYIAPASPFSAIADLRAYTASFADYLYHNGNLELYKVEGIALESDPGESRAAFVVRVSDRLKELKDEAITELEGKYRLKQRRIEEKIERALQKVAKERADVTARSTDTLLSFGTAVLGSLFGRKALSVSTLSRASTGFKNAGRLAREKEEVKRAEEMVLKLQGDIDSLTAEIEEETALLAERYEAGNYPIESFVLVPRRSDIFDLDLYILWEMVPGQVTK